MNEIKKRARFWQINRDIIRDRDIGDDIDGEPAWYSLLMTLITVIILC
jgi:hypothetical protein